MFKNYLDVVDHNLKIIEQELTFVQLAINVINQPGQVIVEIIPDSLLPVSFDKFALEFSDGSIREVTQTIKQQTIMADFSPDYDLIPTSFSFNFAVPQPVKSVQVNARNQITGQPITAVYSAVASD